MQARRRYLVFMSPEPGHLLPARELASRLQARGSEIIFALTSHFLPLFRDAGFLLVDLEGVPFSPDEIRQGSADGVADSLCAAPTGRSFWSQSAVDDAPRATRIGNSLRQLVARWPGCILLIDFLYSSSCGLDLQPFASAGVPYVSISVSLPPWDTAPEALQGRVLVLCPRDLELPSRHIESKDVLYGFPCVCSLPWEGDGFDELEEWQESFPLTVVVSFGTQFRLHTLAEERMRMILQWTEAHPEVGVIIAAGSARLLNLVEASSRSLPNLSVFRVIPQARLLQKAALLLTHGGLSSLKESILARVPVLVFPAHADQPLNAMRVEDRGLGRAVFAEELSYDAVSTAMDHILLTPRYRESAATLSQVFRDEEQSARSLEFLEN